MLSHTVWLLAVLALTTVPCVAAQETIVDNMRQRFLDLNPILVEVQFTEKWITPKKDTPIQFRTDLKFIRHKTDSGLQIRRSTTNRADSASYHNYVTRGQELMQVNWYMENGVRRTSGNGFSIVLSSNELSGLNENIHRYWPSNGQCELPCLGFLYGKSLFDETGFLKEPVFSTANDASDATTVRSDSPFGNIELLVDSESGLPLIVRLVELPRHTHYDELIADWDIKSDIWPSGKVIRTETEVKFDLNADWQSSGKLFNGWTINRQTIFDAEQVFREEVAASVTTFQPGGEYRLKDLWLDMEVPLRTPVSVKDALQLPYLWDGEWAVPAAQSLTPSPLVLKRRSWIVLFNVLLITGAAIWLVSYRRRSR